MPTHLVAKAVFVAVGVAVLMAGLFVLSNVWEGRPWAAFLPLALVLFLFWGGTFLWRGVRDARRMQRGDIQLNDPR